MRCARTLQINDVELHCQLLPKHGHDHLAVAMAPNVSRYRWRWSYPNNLTREVHQTHLTAHLPWAPGMPTPEHAIE